MISHHDSLALIVRHVTFFSKRLKQFDMKLCPPHGFCDPLRWWLADWCRNSYLTRVLWLLHTWWFMVFAWSPKSSVPFSGYVNTEGGKRAQTFCVDDCRVWGHARQGQFWFSPELEFIIGCFLPIPFFPSLPSFFFQRRFPCLLMQHPSKPSWHPQPVCTQWYSPTITGQLCAWNSVSFGSVLSEAEAVLCVESLEKTFCSLEKPFWNNRILDSLLWCSYCCLYSVLKIKSLVLNFRTFPWLLILTYWGCWLDLLWA